MEARSKHIGDFFIAGMRYWDGALVLADLVPGETLTLIAEPHNPNDPDAVAVYFGTTKLGYIPRDHNTLFAQLLYFGHEDVMECRVLKVDPREEPYKQVRIGLYMTDKRAIEKS